MRAYVGSVSDRSVLMSLIKVIDFYAAVDTRSSTREWLAHLTYEGYSVYDPCLALTINMTEERIREVLPYSDSLAYEELPAPHEPLGYEEGYLIEDKLGALANVSTFSLEAGEDILPIPRVITPFIAAEEVLVITPLLVGYVANHARLLISDGAGIYIPYEWASSSGDEWENVDEEDLQILLDGPYLDYYWEAWDNVLGNAYKVEKGAYWVLCHNGDLWEITEDLAMTEWGVY